MRVLITGAAGMLGQDVHTAATRGGHVVVGLSRAECDIADAAAVDAAVRSHAPDVVINCAAYTKVDAAESDAEAAMAVNGRGPGLVAAAAAAAGAWIVHVSTDYVFDGAKRSGPYVESDPTGPRSVYGASKLAGEAAVAAAAPHAHTIVRSSWLFGTGGPCFPATILAAATTRPELRVVDDQVGAPTYTPHLAGALLTLAERREVVGVAHVAAAGECSWFAFASALLAAAQAFEVSSLNGQVTVSDPGDGVGGWAVVHPCSSSEYRMVAERPAYSVLRSERLGVPVLADWHEGMNDYLAARVLAGGRF